MQEVEKQFQCPHCFQHISMLLDLSVPGSQTYIEDCQVCCRPIEITFAADDNSELDFFSAESAE